MNAPGGELVLVLATHNRKKLAEIRRILAAGCDGVTLLALDAFPDVPTAPEEGVTFAANARQKALWYAARTGEICLADDSGLEVDALQGAPGVHSARYAGPDATDGDNRRKLLAALREVPAGRRTARFRCAVALADGDQVLFEADGATDGTLISAERGEGGFGYDPLFLSTELARTFAEADAADKDRVSHRGRALARLVDFLRTIAFEP